MLMLFVFASCGSSPSGEAAKEKPVAEKEPLKVEVINPVSDRPNYELSLPGELSAYEEVAIYPKVKGFVKNIYVDRGSKVKKGQLLAVLEAPEIDQRHLSARSDEKKAYEDYTYSRQSYDRLRKASQKTGAVAAIELDKALSKLKSDSAGYVAIKSNTGVSAQLQQYLSIRAPFDGTVTDKQVSVGALVGENMAGPLFTIIQNERLRLTVDIPEKHTAALSKDTKVSFTVSGQPGKVFQSVLSRKGEFLQQKSRSLTAEFDVVNKGNQFGGGEYAQVSLNMRRPEATLWLPPSSVVKSQAGVFILVVDNGLLKRVPVKTGLRKGDLLEVFGELTAKDQVLKTGTEELKEGEKVNI